MTEEKETWVSLEFQDVRDAKVRLDPKECLIRIWLNQGGQDLLDLKDLMVKTSTIKTLSI